VHGDGALLHEAYEGRERRAVHVYGPYTILYDTFPNVAIALRIFMCLMVSNCSGERSFSRMVLIKNKLRSTMTDSRLSALERRSVECDLLDKISFADIIDLFSTAKSWKSQL
jgi:hypothetical protein